MIHPFQHANNPHDDVPVFNAGDLKKNRALDNYRNNKKVADPMFDFIGLAIRLLPFFCLFAISFLIYYYLWSPHKDLPAMAAICTNVLVYVAGIVTSAMNEARRNRND